MSALDQLPVDVLFIALRYLSVVSLSNLARTCRFLHAMVEEYGWKIYAIENPLPSQSLTPALKSSRWSMRDLVRQQKLAHDAWRSHQFVCRPLGPEWSHKFHPVMAINSSRLVVAAGNALYCYKFTPPTGVHFEAPRVIFERLLTFPKNAKRDISGVAFEPDGRGLILSFVHGAIGRIPLPQSSKSLRGQNTSVQAPTISYIREHGHPIRSMSVHSGTFITMDSVGTASMFSLSDPKPCLVSAVDVGGSSPVTGWSTHLSLHSSSGYAVLGTSSATPLVVHAITETCLSPHPHAVLSPSRKSSTRSALGGVYSITGATKTFPWASPSDQIVISGWYQGFVSIHDLRCPAHGDSSGKEQTLAPVLALQDPITVSPIYSLSSAGAHIAAGSAEHSVVQLYDVRSPKSGWSIYLPQGRPTSSPVYSCMLESTRLWAATESNAFVVDFGQVYEHTFPTLGRRGIMTRSTGSVGWHAPFYDHGMFFNSYN